MFERSETVLRIICLGLAALLLYQLSRFALRGDPLARLGIPAVPTLAAATNAPTVGKGANSPPAKTSGKQGTNLAPSQASAKMQTNSVAGQGLGKRGTNTLC